MDKARNLFRIQFQAILTAPLFVLLEVMFFFGYRKEFHERIMQQVEKNIREFKNKKAKWKIKRPSCDFLRKILMQT